MDISPLKEHFPTLRENEPLSKYSTFRVGGPARLFYEASNIDEIPELIKMAKQSGIPYFIAGGGSNVLFPDEGVDGLVIKITATNVKIDDDRVEAEAGAIMSTIEPFGALRSIPGTVGGAVRGNAGALGIEIADIIESVLVYDPESEDLKTLKHDELEMDYRHSRFKKTDEIILKATFDLAGKDMGDFTEAMTFRREKQPANLCAGSFFKNPSPEKSAGYLIDQAGLKGHKIGDAQISEQHANFFVNNGEAKAADILALAELAKSEVKKQFDIDLEPEVHIIRTKT